MDAEALMDATQKLAMGLAESECCRAYSAAREDVHANPSLLEKLGEYKKKSAAYRMAAANGEPSSQETEMALSELYWELMLDNKARRFLESEKEAAALAAKLCEMIAAACPVDPIFPSR